MNTTNAQTKRFLNFSLGSEQYALPLLEVREVIAVPEITPVPFTPAHFLGIMNLRGQVISIMDLRAKLNIKPLSGQEQAAIICDLEPYCFALIVDSINRVLTLGEGQIEDRVEMNGAKVSEFIAGVIRMERQPILILDIAKTFNIDME